MASFDNEDKKNNLTIMNLFYFFKNKDTENDYNKNMIDKFIYQLDNDDFWLGGQIKLLHDDIINLKLIQRVKEINKKRLIEYGAPCNSFEMMSVYSSTKQIELIEDMIIKYNELN
jgi:hypothetical protein